MKKKLRESQELKELLTEYLGLLDEEFRQMAKNGRVSKRLKMKIADCEARIDEAHNRRLVS